MILEFPHSHPALQGAEVDTLIRPADGREPIAIEFKYDRGNKGGANQNRTQRAASALTDVFRLAKIPKEDAAKKYFIYVTDREMAGYFKNPANRLNTFFEPNDAALLNLGASTFQSFSKTFLSKVSPFMCDCRVFCTFATDLPTDHCIRIWEVLPYNSPISHSQPA